MLKEFYYNIVCSKHILKSRESAKPVTISMGCDKAVLRRIESVKPVLIKKEVLDPYFQSLKIAKTLIKVWEVLGML